MEDKGTDETRCVMIANLIRYLFNRQISRFQHSGRCPESTVAAIVLHCKTGFSFKQVAQPRNAEMTTTGEFGERERCVLIQEPHGFLDPEILLNTFH